MALSGINSVFSVKQVFWSNILLAICCAFYLAWWLAAFKPTGAVKGIKSGWLLIPAFAAGLISIITAVKGIQSAPVSATLFPKRSLLWGGIAAYIILLLITQFFFKRKVTTELVLIVGWAAMMMSEIDMLYGIGHISHGTAAAFVAVVAVFVFISLGCYVIYYRLSGRAGYFDGMVPLLLVALAAVCVSAVAA